jgi:hypothetical protein
LKQERENDERELRIMNKYDATIMDDESGRIEMAVEEGDDIADMFVRGRTSATVGVRLNRQDLLNLIQVASEALVATMEE